MSATFDYILEPICKEEIAILNNKINEINYQISNQPETYYPTYITMLPHPLRKSKNYLPKAEYYFNNNVITYEFPRDFSQYDYKFFSKINQIEELIKETNNNDKWLIFLDDKKACKKLCNNLNSFFSEQNGISSSEFATFIDSSSRNFSNNKDSFLTWHQLKNNGKFDSCILITTSVLDNGFGIKDSKLKNIVIFSDDKTEFLQELGRCRIDKNKKINLFIKKMTDNSHSNRIKNHEKLADFFEEYDANQDNTDLIIKNHWLDKDNFIRSLIKLIFNTENRLIPIINSMARWRTQILKQQINEYEQSLAKYGTKAEILYKAFWLMNESDIENIDLSKLDFSDIDLDLIDYNKKFNSLIDFLKAKAEKEEALTKGETSFTDFAKEFEKLFILAFPNDKSIRKGNDRESWQETSIRNRLKTVNQQLNTININTQFEFIKIDKDKKQFQLNIKQ